MSTIPRKPTVQGWHLGVGMSGLMFVATAVAGDLGHLCSDPTFTQSLTAGNFMAVGLTVIEFLLSKSKGQ